MLAHYHPDFCCVRSASVERAVAWIDRATMMAIRRSQACAGDSGTRADAMAPTPTETLLVKACGDWGVALLLRDKHFGPGKERVFYNLVWKRCDNAWLLWREYVQQQHVPAWAKGGDA